MWGCSPDISEWRDVVLESTEVAQGGWCLPCLHVNKSPDWRDRERPYITCKTARDQFSPWLSSLCPGLPFRSLLPLGGGTGNVPLISLRPPLITEHHFVSSINDRARKIALRSAKLRRCPSCAANALLPSPRSDHDSRCDRTTEHQQSCSKTADFESIILITHSFTHVLREAKKIAMSRRAVAIDLFPLGT